MTTDERDVVSAMRESLAGKVGKQKFDLWFADAAFVLGTGKVIVEAPNEFKKEVLRTNFAAELRAAAAASGDGAVIEFRVNHDLAPRRVYAPEPAREAHGSPATPAKPAEPGAARTGRRFADFASFVVGAANRLAFSAAQNAAQWHGAAPCASLLLYGPTGVGKTHLAEAVWSTARRSAPQRRLVYLTAEQFTSQFVDAVRGSGLPSFRNKVRGADLLIVDDVQFFAGKRATLVELLYTIDTLLAEGRRIVLTADRPPAELIALGPELITRLSSGMLCRIEPPDYQTRYEIARRAACHIRFEVRDDVLALVARRIAATAREIGGALYRLQAIAVMTGEPPSRALAEQSLADLFADHGRTIRLADIEAAVCDAFGLESDALKSDCRSKHASHPRMLAMFLARKHTRAALSEIGRYFGGRKHTTVLSAQKTVERWLARSERVALADQTWQVEQAIRRLEDKLRVG